MVQQESEDPEVHLARPDPWGRRDRRGCADPRDRAAPPAALGNKACGDSRAGREALDHPVSLVRLEWSACQDLVDKL